MGKMIQKEFRMQLSSLWQMGLITLGLFAVGDVLSVVLSASGDGDEVAAIGWIFGLMGFGFWLFVVGCETKSGLETAILMSRTRKSYLVAHYAVNFCYSAVMLAFIWLLGKLEEAMCGLIWPGVPLEVKLDSWFSLPIALLIVVGGVIVATFLGALVARFGKRAFWVLWTLWMFGFVVLPRMLDKDNADTVLGMAGQALVRWISALPPTMWKTLLTCGLLLCLGLTPVLLRRHAITN